MATTGPAANIRRSDELGTLAPGRSAEVSVLRIDDTRTDLPDGYEAITAERVLVPGPAAGAGVPLAPGVPGGRPAGAGTRAPPRTRPGGGPPRRRRRAGGGGGPLPPPLGPPVDRHGRRRLPALRVPRLGLRRPRALPRHPVDAGRPTPARARVAAYEAEARHGLAWVRLDPAAGTAIPACPAVEDPAMKVLAGEPYTWPVSALRRVENFVGLAHFAFVHDGTLGRRDQPVPPIPDVRRRPGDGVTNAAELAFNCDPPAYPDDMAREAMLASSAYRMPMPCTVDIEFRYPDGRRRQLWMTASPVDDGVCRSFWYVGRTDGRAGDDRDHLAFQAVMTAEDEPIVSAHAPAELPLELGAELSVRTDKVSIEYRRWLRELASAALSGPSAYAGALGVAQRREHSA